MKPFPFRQYRWILLGAALLLWPAFYNGYPLLNPDDNTYLLSGIKPDTPFDRPITYGLLLRVMSFNTVTLWGAVCLQAIWFSSMLFAVSRLLCPSLPDRHTGLLLLVLCGTTALAWETSQLMPDLYTAIAFFTWIRILWEPRPAWWLYPLFFAAAATHISHLHLFAGLSFAVLLAARFVFSPAERRTGLRRLGLCFGLLLGTIVTMGSALSKSRHVFYLGSMHNRGVLRPYLDAACPTRHFRLCDAKEALGPNGDYFLWDPASPLYTQGGDWADKREDYTRIISGSFQDPVFRCLQITTTLHAAGRQLLCYDLTGYDRAFRPGDALYETIAAHYPAERHLMAGARQQRGTLAAAGDATNAVQRRTIPVTAFALALLMIGLRKSVSRRLGVFVALCLLLLLLNAATCGAFTTVNGRYGARVMWLLPFCTLLLAGSARARRSGQA